MLSCGVYEPGGEVVASLPVLEEGVWCTIISGRPLETSYSMQTQTRSICRFARVSRVETQMQDGAFETTLARRHGSAQVWCFRGSIPRVAYRRKSSALNGSTTSCFVARCSIPTDRRVCTPRARALHEGNGLCRCVVFSRTHEATTNRLGMTLPPGSRCRPPARGRERVCVFEASARSWQKSCRGDGPRARATWQTCVCYVGPKSAAEGMQSPHGGTCSSSCTHG